MIEAAMRESAPAMHRQLKMSCTLQSVLTSRAELARESYEIAMSEAMTQVLKSELPPMERSGTLAILRTEAASAAIAQAVEFEREAVKESDMPEPTQQGAPRKALLYKNENEGGRTTVDLELLEDGSIRLFYYDIGRAARYMFGDSDYESWITVPISEVPALAFQLLSEKYGDRSDAVTNLRSLCEEHGIKHEHHVWI